MRGLAAARTALFGISLALAGAAAEAAGTYHRASPLPIRMLDPAYATNAAEQAAIRDLFEGLTVLGPDGSVRPGVAESWTVSEDGLTWRFRLRAARWTDGRNVTASDFQRAFRRLVDPATASPHAGLLAPVAGAADAAAGKAPVEKIGVAAPESRLLEIRLDEPVPHLPLLLANPAFSPQAATEGVAGDGFRSNGPFALAAFEPGKSLRLVRNGGFHDAASVGPDAVEDRLIANPEEALAAFREGRIDSYDGVPVYAIGTLKAELGDRLRVAPYLGTLFLALRADDAALADPNIRRALSLAIDREAIAGKVWGGTMLPAGSFVPPGIASYGKPAGMADHAEPLAARLEKAKSLLAEAGHGGKTLKLKLAVPEGELEQNTAAALAAAWAPLGVETEIAATEPQRHYGELSRGRFQIALVGWIGDYAEASAFLGMLASGNEAENYAGYTNAEYDGLLAEAGKTMDGEVRSALALSAETILLRDLPVIPVSHYASLSLVAPRLKGWQDNADNIHPSRWLSVEETAQTGTEPKN